MKRDYKQYCKMRNKKYYDIPRNKYEEKWKNENSRIDTYINLLDEDDKKKIRKIAQPIWEEKGRIPEQLRKKINNFQMHRDYHSLIIQKFEAKYL